VAGALSLVAKGVKGDAVVLLGLEVEDFGGDVFQGAEELAFIVEQEIGVGAFALDVKVTALEAVGVGGACAGGDAVLEAKASSRGEQPHERGYAFCGLREIFHSRGFLTEK
jgi:hypothetical protein